jgi:hypothetical protein
MGERRQLLYSMGHYSSLLISITAVFGSRREYSIRTVDTGVVNKLKYHHNLRLSIQEYRMVNVQFLHHHGGLTSTRYLGIS